MKRSEALKIIDTEYTQFVEDWVEADISELSGFVRLEERILTALEKAGMLAPPNRAEAVTRSIVYCYYYNGQVDELDPECNSSHVNQSKLWDKE